MKHIPDVQKRMEAGTATLTWMVANFMKSPTSSAPEYADMYSVFAKNDPLPYPREVAMAMARCMKMDLMSQLHLIQLGQTDVLKSVRAYRQTEDAEALQWERDTSGVRRFIEEQKAKA